MLLSCVGVDDVTPARFHGKRAHTATNWAARPPGSACSSKRIRVCGRWQSTVRLMLLDLRPGLERRYVVGENKIPSEYIPSESSCNVITANIPDPGARYAAMIKNAAWTSAQQSYDELSSLINSINNERARYAFGFSSLATIETAKENVKQLIRNYG